MKGHRRAERRRRFAGWLLLAWMATWLMASLAPCCLSVFNAAYAAEEAVIGQTCEADCATSLSHEYRGPLCDTFVTSQSAPPGGDLLLPARDITPALIMPSIGASTITPFAARERVSARDISPSRIPLYLRTSRLLI